MSETDVVSPTKEVNTTEQNPFDTSSKSIVLPVELSKEIKAEEKTTSEKKDPVIEEKDKKIEKEKPVITKTDEPDKVPTATPKDIPARTAEEKKDPTHPIYQSFKNDASKKIYEAILNGDEDTVLDFLSQKKTLASIDKMPPAEVIKLKLKSENKDYTPEEINDLYSETYSAPEKPEQGMDETDEDFKKREDKYNDKVAKFERKIEREAKSSKLELQKQAQELVLPDIQKPEPQPTQPSQKELDETAKARENYLTSIGDGLDDFKSIDATYKDKEVEIPVAYKISADEKKDLRQLMENFNLEQFIQDRWITKDGKFNTAQQAKDLFLLTKGDAAIGKLVNEVGTKRHAETIKGQKNVDYSGTSKSGSFQPNPQERDDKMAEFFLRNN